MASTSALTIRRADVPDEPAVQTLLAASLGWNDDERHAALFSWKHHENAFGPSPAWVAVDESTGTLAGFRVFLRWEFRRGHDIVRAVRAVDTATHPEYRGRGLFTKLTLHALEECRADDVAWVFNTPNDQSRPGYLKMGWREVGRLPAQVRPTSAPGLWQMARARTPAGLWSEPSSVGEPVLDVLADEPGLERLIALQPSSAKVHTHLSPAFLRWRFGSVLFNYRAVLAGSDIDDGVAILRVRRRGAAREAALVSMLVPGAESRARRALVRKVAPRLDADYLIALGRERRDGLLPLPRQGPLLAWRAVCDDSMPNLHDWSLSLGDIELF